MLKAKFGKPSSTSDKMPKGWAGTLTVDPDSDAGLKDLIGFNSIRAKALTVLGGIWASFQVGTIILTIIEGFTEIKEEAGKVEGKAQEMMESLAARGQLNPDAIDAGKWKNKDAAGTTLNNYIKDAPDQFISGYSAEDVVATAQCWLIIALAKLGTVTSSYIDKRYKDMVKEMGAIESAKPTPEQIRDLYSMVGERLTEQAKKDLVALAAESTTLRFKLTAQQADETGFTALVTIRDIMKAHPRFPWEALHAEYGDEKTKLDAALTALGADKLHAFNPKANELGVTKYPHYFWFAQKIKTDIDDDRSFKDYRGTVDIRDALACTTLFDKYKAMAMEANKYTFMEGKLALASWAREMKDLEAKFKHQSE